MEYNLQEVVEAQYQAYKKECLKRETNYKNRTKQDIIALSNPKENQNEQDTQNIVEKNLILDNKISFKSYKSNDFGILYFLLKDNEIVYIGTSERGIQRIFEHLNIKDFDSYSCFPFPKTDLPEIEAKHIFHYKPKYNSLTSFSKKISPWRSKKSISDIFNINTKLLNKLIFVYKLDVMENIYINMWEFKKIFDIFKKANPTLEKTNTHKIFFRKTFIYPQI